MNVLWRELAEGFGDGERLSRILVRLAVAVLLGGLVGLERQREGKAAGFRTHMIVALGAALFTLLGSCIGMDSHDLSRIVQGVAAGVGFLGAGTILKLSEQHHIEGLTSAATIWVTAAVGAAIGAGSTGPAIVAAGLAWLILYFAGKFEHRYRWASRPPRPPAPPHAGCDPDEE